MAYTEEVQRLIADPFGGRTADDVRALCTSDLALAALEHPAPPFLLTKFAEDEGLDLEQCGDLFEQTKRFLLVGQVLDAHIAPGLLVDKMWHAWILFTNDYHDFCGKVGGYIHHLPIPQGDAAQPPLEPTIAVMEAGFGPLDERYWPIALGSYGIMDCKKGP
jgi:hypothetical protein